MKVKGMLHRRCA